jgi:hypothetical protein
MEQAAASGRAPTAVHRDCGRILRDGLSKGGQRFRSEFPRGFRLNFSEPQYLKIATNLLRGNQSNWHGYLRELKYLNDIARKQSPFKIVLVGDRAPLRSGQVVEFDALLEDKRTRLKVSAEIKDWRIDSRQSLEKAKLQIDKISRRAGEHGVARTMWINRQEIPKRYRQELLSFASRRNVGVYSGISTSNKLPHNLKTPQRFDDVLKHESKALRHIKIGRMAGRSAGILGAAYGLGEVGYSAFQWNKGSITTRRATISASEGVGAAAGGLAGAATGASIGGTIGTAVPFVGNAVGAVGGGIIGGVVGAFGGSAAGSASGTLLVDQVIFKDLEEKETEALITFLQQHYQPKP